MANTVIRIKGAASLAPYAERFSRRLVQKPEPGDKMLLVRDLQPAELEELSRDSQIQVCDEQMRPLLPPGEERPMPVREA